VTNPCIAEAQEANDNAMKEKLSLGVRAKLINGKIPMNPRNLQQML